MIILDGHELFVSHKDGSFKVFLVLCKHIQNEKDFNIASIISDYEGEFENENFQQFYEEHGILHNFSCPRTPQHNEMAKTMLNDFNSPKYFWAKAINIKQILGNIQDRVRTWSTFKDQAQMALLLEVEPKNINEALLDNRWILIMQEELDQF
ncbi:hypothetical protein CR513_11738, partial [Mucuna pruriens]